MSPRIEITRETIIAELIRAFPQCITVFDKHDMPCRTCIAVNTATIAEGALMHSVDLDVVIAELRECCGGASAGNSPPASGS